MIIWKYELAITDIQQLEIPHKGTILSVANQNGKLCLWALVNPNLVSYIRTIEIIGTGNPIDKSPVERKFIGTAVINPFVWHVFERT